MCYFHAALVIGITLSTAQITVHSAPSKNITITEPSKTYQPPRNLGFDSIEQVLGQTLLYRDSSNKTLHLQFFTKSTLHTYGNTSYVYKKTSEVKCPSRGDVRAILVLVRRPRSIDEA